MEKILEVKNSEWIYFPDLGIEMTRSPRYELHGLCWKKANWKLKEGERMISLPEFPKILKALRNPQNDHVKDVLSVMTNPDANHYSAYKTLWPERSFNLGAMFEDYHRINKGDVSNVCESRAFLHGHLRGCHFISIDDYVNNPTKNGLPKKNVIRKNITYSSHERMKYYSPVGHSNTATMGVASGTFYLDCRGDSYFSDDENISRRMTYVVRKPKSKLCDLIHKK